MRYVTYAMVMAFAVGAVSIAHACPNMKTAQTPTTVAAVDGQSAPASTKIRIPTPKAPQS